MSTLDPDPDGRMTPEPPTQPAAAAPVPGDPSERVVLEVSAPLRTLAVRGGLTEVGEVLSIPADRYMAAAHRLAHEWSRIVPAAIATYKALAAGMEWPATLTPELLDVLLVHDHECLAAREHLRAKEVAREQAQQALRTRNVDQDLDAKDAQRMADPQPAAAREATGRAESGQGRTPQGVGGRSEFDGWDR